MNTERELRKQTKKKKTLAGERKKKKTFTMQNYRTITIINFSNVYRQMNGIIINNPSIIVKHSKLEKIIKYLKTVY